MVKIERNANANAHKHMPIKNMGRNNQKFEQYISWLHGSFELNTIVS